MKRKGAVLVILALLAAGCKLGGSGKDSRRSPPPRVAGPTGTGTATGSGARRDVSFRVEVLLRRAGQGGVGYADVKPLLDGRCVSCHGEGNALDLRAYPLVGRFPTQAELADEVLRRVRDGARPMPPPPAPRLGEEDIGMLQAWRDGGAREAAPASTLANALVVKLSWPEGSASWPWNGTGVFTGQAAGLAVGGAVDFTLAAFGEDGQAVAQKEFPATAIGGTGDLAFSLEVDEGVLQAQGADGVPPTPGNGGAVQVGDLRGSSFSVSFAPASDAVTAAADLRYAVYVGETRDAVETPAQAASRARLARDWGPAVASVPIDGLVPGKTYYVLVVVRDGRGNLAPYRVVEQKAVDDLVAPQVEGGGLTLAQVTDATAVLSWARASDDTTAPEALRYQVVVVNGSDELPVGAALFGRTSLELAGLNPQTVYEVNVHVEDQAGNKASYTATRFTSGAGVGGLSLSAYAGQCAQRLGRLKPMNCLDGEIIPITIEGVPIPTELTATQASSYRFGTGQSQQSCDKPALLELGEQGQCIPYSRVMRVDSFRPDGSKHPDVDTILLCRRYTARLGRHSWRGQSYEGAKSPAFEDIAIIQHNRVTGETCWFQALPPLGESKDARRVPPPDEGALPAGTPSHAERASTFWLSPAETAQRDCVMCHDADPWMHSPYIDQVRLSDGSSLVFSGMKASGGRTGRYSVVGSRYFPSWTMPTALAAAPLANGRSCTSCHELGSRESCARWISQSAGKSFPPNLSRRGRTDFHLSHWMPPPGEAGANQAAWDQAGWGEAADRLLSCCARPSSPGCTSKPLITPPPPYAGK